MPDFDPDLIRRRLKQFRREDPHNRAFGASGHRYRLGPRLAESELRELESRYGLSLPADYRQFLSVVGNGGAGPGYGLHRVQMQWLEHVARPFHPLTTYEAFQASEEDPDEHDGLLILCDHGCGHSGALVITGEERGAVYTYVEPGWMPETAHWSEFVQRNDGDSGRAVQEFYAHFHSTPRLTFYDWYMTWLLTNSPKRQFEQQRKYRQRVQERLTAPAKNLNAVRVMLASDSEITRRNAVYELNRTHEPAAIQALLEMLGREHDLYVRVQIIQTLRSAGGAARPAIPTLTRLVRESAEYLILTNALKALPAIDPRAAIPVLVEATTSRHSMIRFDAAHLLGEYGDASVVSVLEELLSDDTMPGEGTASTAWSVGENARRALDCIARRRPLTIAWMRVKRFWR